MANTYKNIVIVPNIGSNTADPRIVFSGANTTVNTDITLSVNPSTNGTLSIDGDRQLFSVTNSMVGIHFSVNDANGIPNIEITDSGIIRLAQYTGNVQILGGQAATSNTTGELQVTGGVGITGNVYTGNIVITGITSNGITFADGTRQTTAATSGSSGVDASQNVRIDYSNTALTIAQGVDNSQNVRIDYSNTVITILQGVNAGQNSNIAFVQTLANTDFTNVSIATTTSSSNGLYIPVITVAANGRVTAISNTLITGGGSSAGYLANSVIFANTTGYLSNTANLSFTSSTNTLKANGKIVIGNTSTTNTATIQYNAANNSIEFVFN